MTTEPSTTAVTIELTEPVLKRINDMRGGVSLSDYIAELINEHLKKQKPIPPEVVDRALID